MSQPKNLAVIILIALAIFWGSSFILMKEGLKSFNWLDIAAFRMGLAGIVFWPFVLKHRQTIQRADWKHFAVVGIVGSGLPSVLFPLAQTHVASGIAGALNALTPLFTFLIGIVFLGVVFESRKLWAVLIGLAGALILILMRADGGFDTDYRYGLLILLATICYGTSVNVVKYRLHSYRPLMVAALPLSIISVIAWIVLGVRGFSMFEPMANEVSFGFWKSLGALVLLSLVGTAFSLIIFNRLIKMSSAVFASSVTYLIPIVALFWGILDGEPIGWLQLFGVVLILVAIYFMKQKKVAVSVKSVE
jgi:drug/metabolite transporter (DMT)-like permease